MRTRTAQRLPRSRGGQTIIIAMIVLGVLLIIGFVFLGIVSRNVRSTALSQTRSAAREVADAGLSFAHNQLLTSPQGADWRPAVTRVQSVAGQPDLTLDPDILYLRPPSNLPFRNDADAQIDKGGPDGLGPFTRVDFPNSRSLIRVRYAPSDANLFITTPSGPLRKPGRARAYTIIESVGRPGTVSFNDPTTLGTNRAVKFQGFADSAELNAALAEMRRADNQLTVRSAKAIAFASIGIIEATRYITNRDNVSRPAEVGVDNEMGAVYRDVKVATGRLLADGTPVTTPLAVHYGTSENLFDLGNPPIPTTGEFGFGGGLYSNADLRIHGDLYLKLNPYLGDAVAVDGTIIGADSDSRLNLQVTDVDGSGAWQAPVLTQLQNATIPSLNSRSSNFSTVGGLLLDGLVVADSEGYARGVGRKEPPSISAVDSETGLNRYLAMTRESGMLTASGFTGRFGHGQGVYVNNSADRQVRFDDQGREQVATAESQVYDWLNPNNGLLGSGWEGPFYRPRAATVILLPDGFIIYRDPRGPEDQTWWRGPDGNIGVNKNGIQEQRHDIRFRLGYDAQGVLRIVNTFTPDPVNPTQAIDINAATIPWEAGQPFNGVLYFEGNVRVRGVIPTDIQMTLVSNASIYIDGSITKGVQFPDGSTLSTRSSLSLLGLFARDFVVLNTTMFFGPAAGQDLEEADDTQSALAYNPIRSRASTITLLNEMILDPSFNPENPAAWQPYATNYREYNGPGVDDGAAMDALLMLTQASDDGPAPAAFYQLDVNEGLSAQPSIAPLSTDGVNRYNKWDYLFEMSDHNAATQPYLDAGVAPGTYIPDYGLGVEAWQRYPRFEAIGYPLVMNGFVYDDAAQWLYSPGGDAGTVGAYALLTQAENFLTLWTGTSNTGLASEDYLLARTAITPHDIRIEAVMFAEQGSFFVIPGPPYNPNPNDRWEVFAQAVNDYGGFGNIDAVEQAQRERLENFGAFPETPFFGEPLDVRISIVGAISENMPQPMSVQARWLERWGWIPRQLGGSFDLSGAVPRPVLIPKAHVPDGYDIRPTSPDAAMFVPNLTVAYDPALATGTVGGFNAPIEKVVRTHWVDFDGDDIVDPGEEFMLPPLPRLPVSPQLSYFGEVNQ